MGDRGWKLKEVKEEEELAFPWTTLERTKNIKFNSHPFRNKKEN